MARADVIASIFKETGSNGVADAVKSLGGLINCANAGEAAKVLLGATAAGGLGLIALVGGSLIDAYQRKKDMKALQDEFRKVHRTLQGLQDLQIDSKEWLGLIDELAEQHEGVPASKTELDALQQTLQVAMREQTAAHATEIDAWFRSVAIYLSNFDERLRRIFAKQDELLAGQARIETSLANDQQKDRQIAALQEELLSTLADNRSLRGRHQSLEQEIEYLRSAVRGYVNEAPAQNWKLAIEEVRADPKRLVTFLKEQLHRENVDAAVRDLQELRHKLHMLATVSLLTGQPAESEAAAEKLLRLDPCDFFAHHLLVGVYLHMGQLQKARASANKCFACARSDEERAVAFASAGSTELALGDAELSSFFTSASISLDGDQVDPDSLSVRLGNLGSVLNKKGKHHESLRHHREALRLGIVSGSTHNLGNHYGSLGIVALYCGKFELSWRMTVIALRVFQDTKSLTGEAAALEKLGLLASLVPSERPRAARYLRDAAAINERVAAKADLAVNLHNLGIVLMDMNDPNSATAAMVRAAALFDELGFAERAQATRARLNSWAVPASSPP